MLTAIVIDDLGSLVASLDKAQMLTDIAVVGETFVISTDPAPVDCAACTWIQQESLVEGLAEAAQAAASKRILVVSASLAAEGTAFSRLAAEAEVSPLAEHLACTIRAGDKELAFPISTPESIIPALANEELWPALCVATTRTALRAAADAAHETATEYFVCAIINAIANGDSVRSISSVEVAVQPTLVRSLCELEDSARARALTVAVDAINIEELFPAHAWASFSQESAAAAYHSLAALFIRFGDIDAATECLACSERLEESPRYFALKGLLQHKKGETLGAVANLVSSLQCYETRKTSDGKHYLSFKPSNLEIINSRLVDGLNALNRHENDKALTHFSEAVFNFDPFYAAHGVRTIGKNR